MIRGRKTALQLGWSIVLFFMASVTQAQKQVPFSDMGFEQAMAAARKTNKVIFVDVSMSTKSSLQEKVEAEVFTADSVARYFGKHLISIRMPMNTEEGKKFAPRLAMLMYPAYVFYDGEGNQLEFTNAGSVAKTPGVLMEKARASVASAALRIANKKRIRFDTSRWNQVLLRAKKENKLVFVDAYTEWCRPCIMMAKNVFTLDTIADYFNTHFVNITMDMEKGEGPVLSKKYSVKAYPTFLFIDGDGKLVHTSGGYMEAPEFIKVGEAAVAAQAKTASGIRFGAGNWESMLAEARKTGKLIFVDAHTTWCGPCKWMTANVFNTTAVGDVYNRNFINAYTDMEKGEGIALRTKYQVKAYPTYLFIDGNGEVVHRVVGSCPAGDFIQHGLDALSPTRNLRYLTNNAGNNSTNPDYVKTYLEALQKSYNSKAADSVALGYLLKLDSSTWVNSENWQLINEYVKDVTTPVFRYLVSHQQQFEQRYGTAKVADKIYNSYLAWPQQYVQYPEKNKAVLNENGFNAYMNMLQSGTYNRKAEVMAKSRLTIYSSTRNWASYVSTVNEMRAGGIITSDATGAEQLYGYADMVNRFAGTDRNAVHAASLWAADMITVPGISIINKASYQELYASLLEKDGQQQLAVQVRQQIDKQKLTEAQNANPMKQMRIIPKQPS